MPMKLIMDTYFNFRHHACGNKALVCALIAMSLCSYVTFMLLIDDVVTEPASAGIIVDTHALSNTNIATRFSRWPRGKDVLLFAYMRSGSSLVGDFYRNSPGTFYVFEPLIPLASYHYFTDRSVCEMRKTNCELLNITTIQEPITTIHNLYSCNIRDVPKLVIDEIVKQNKSGVVWWYLGKCLNISQHAAYGDYAKCFDQIEHACRKAEVKVFKILRLSFIHMKFFLRTIPNLHVLFLLRDPRAILNSRISTDWFPVSENDTTEVKQNVDSLCEKMNDDIVWYEQTRAEYEDRILRIDIENVTENKQEMMKLMHYFRDGYEMQKEDKKFLDFVFKKKKEKRLFRDWRHSLKDESKQYTDEKCSHVLSYLDKQTSMTSPDHA